MNTKLIFDTNWVINKTYYVSKSQNPNFDLDNKEIWFATVRKCITDICSIIRSFKLEKDKDEIWFCFDEGESFRKSLYPGYKSGRKEKDEKLRELFSEIKTLVKSEFNVLSIKGLEADDLMYQLCLLKNHNVIVTADEDLQQLVSDTVCIYRPLRGNCDLISTKGYFEGLFDSPSFNFIQVDPKLILLKKILLGCESDEIPRLLKKGVGPKTIEKYYSELSQEESILSLVNKICEKVRYALDEDLIVQQQLLVDLSLGRNNYSNLQISELEQVLNEDMYGMTTKKVNRSNSEYKSQLLLEGTRYINNLI